MRFASSRGAAATASFSAALLQGLAPDGGLYVPGRWPGLSVQSFEGATHLPVVAARVIAAFAAGDALAPQVNDIVTEAFSFPAPRVSLDEDDRLSVLELFHGPTAAFKDFGARFLAAAFARLHPTGCRAADHPGGHFRGHRRGGRRRIPPRPGHPRRGAVPQGPGLAHAGAPADLLGRQRAFAVGARHASMTASAW